MELALPHVVIRVCGPGVGPDLVAALGVYPVEVSEARDASEAQRVACGRAAVLVVVTDPPHADAATIESWKEFPRTPILVVGGSTTPSDVREPVRVAEAVAKGWVDAVPAGLTLPEICWHVMVAISRATCVAGVPDRPLGPVLLEIDDSGCILSEPVHTAGFIVNGHRIRTGAGILPVFEPNDRAEVVRILERLHVGEVRFCPLRLIGAAGSSHASYVGMHRLAADRVELLAQPLIPGGPIVGRHINDRDAITGLLTRWALSRLLEERERDGEAPSSATIMLVRLDNLPPISEYIGSHATDAVLVRVASDLGRIMPYPAVCSRPMGNTFIVYLPDVGIDDARRRADVVIDALHGIAVPGFAAGFRLAVSVGVAIVARRDYDLAIRSATTAAAAAAGGDRAVVAGPTLTHAQIGELAEKVDLGDWELWLQPVLSWNGDRAGDATFHESLARFMNGAGHLITRPDFFVTGRGQGLLARFDRMMLQRAVQILATHPTARLSVNLSLETFVSEAFPASVLDVLREAPDCCARLILEIAPHCLTTSAASVLRRMETLAEAGVAVALDDFGSGICRLSFLTQFPLAMVKFDELVTGYVDDDPLQREFVRAVVSICRARGITTVAEYVRSPEQLKRLVADGVDLFQGELFGMPVPAAEAIGAPVAGAASA